MFRFASPVLLCFLACLAASGCSGPSWKRDLIYSVSPVALFREHQITGSTRAPLGYKHPVDLPVKLGKAILGSITYEERHVFRADRDVPLFKPKEVDALALPLSLALKEATPDERIRFLVARSNWSDAVVGTSGISGVVFSSEEGRLNIAFDYLNDKLLGAESGKPEDIVFRDEPTEYTGGAPVIPPLGTRLHSGEDGQVYSRWLEVSLADFQTLSEGTTATEAAAAAPAPAAPPASAGKTDYENVRRKVETLKRLRNDGVLSEDEFRQQLETLLEGEPDAK